METNQNPTETVDFDKIVEQSKENFVDLKDQPKRKPGRQPGWRKKNAESTAAEPVKKADKKDFKQVEGVVLKDNEIEPLATELIKAPFDVVGWKTGVDITPTDDEAKAPTKYLSKLIEQYMPDLNSQDPKTFNFIALLITLSLLAVKKLRIFATIKKVQKNEAPQQAAPQTAQQEEIIQTGPQTRVLPKEEIPAANMFNRGPM